MITPRSYAKRLTKTQGTLSKRLKSFLKEGNEKSVHDLRTSIRRLATTVDVLPKKIRKGKKSKRYVEESDRLLKLNAKVRDLDIISEKLPRTLDGPEYKQFLSDLRQTRKSELKKAQKYARSINSNGFSLRASDLRGSALRNRYKKNVGRLTKQIQRELPVVLSDHSKRKELHRLREDARTLRYTLELERDPSVTRFLSVLEGWQEVLGAIHDSDIFIMRFENDPENLRLLKEALAKEEGIRKENYEKFVATAKESPSLKLLS